MEQLFNGQKKRKKDIKIDYSKKKENFFCHLLHDCRTDKHNNFRVHSLYF